MTPAMDIYFILRLALISALVTAAPLQSDELDTMDRDYLIDVAADTTATEAVESEIKKCKKIDYQTRNSTPKHDIEVVKDNIQLVNPYAKEITARPALQALDVIEYVNEGMEIDGLTEVDIMTDLALDHSIVRRAATKNREILWTEGIVSYRFEKNFRYIGKVRKAMDEIEVASCVLFEKHSENSTGNKLVFTSESGCWSYVGSVHENQSISIGKGCQGPGTILHLLLHALGFYHEQSRSDRDDYVIVNYTNVQSGKEAEFSKKTERQLRNLNQYNYQSIMHLSGYAFSSNGLPTITVKGNPTAVIGQHRKLSPLDVESINLLYRCSNAIDGTWSPWSHLTSCSATCGDGIRFRTRNCAQPSPSYGGTDCVGESYESELCTIKACGEAAGEIISCDFELGMCGWTSEVGNGKQVLVWARDSGGTPSASTGPSVDHTFESSEGHYLYTETSAPGRKGQLAELVSPELGIIENGSKRCLTYWVNLHGKSMGRVMVIQRDLETNQNFVLRKHAGDLADVWYLNEITLDSSYVSQVIFQGFKGNSYRSDMALDDIIISPGECHKAGEYSCDFEGSTCKWRLNNTAQYPLLLNHGPTPSKDTGPTKAKSRKGYLYAEASSPAQMGDKSTLTSPYLPASSSALPYCMKLSYNMNGGDVGALRVYTKAIRKGKVLLKEYGYSTGDIWETAKLTIPASQKTKIIIEMERGTTFKGDIAIDNIIITNGPC